MRGGEDGDQADRIYEVRVGGAAEARYLADPERGPLAPDDFRERPPGHIEVTNGNTVHLDEPALVTLMNLGHHEDGRVTWRDTDSAPVMHFGRDMYPISET
ncbi:MAG TPA: hypothetical protein VG253_27815 [Streptosporangiaceae bacterium]|nr:hypothetical protein [Streptosporangiaceae bacterium]